MPISSGANGWPIRHFKKAPAPEPKLKKFVNVAPRDPYYPTPIKQPRPISPPVVFYSSSNDRRIRPSPSPPLTPEPRRKPRRNLSPEPSRRKQYSPPPSPVSNSRCCGNGGTCGRGCCSRMCSNSVCCWSDDSYRQFSQRGTWWSNGGRKASGCCGNACCRRLLACLIGLVLLLLLVAFILALVFGIQAYNRRSTVTTVPGQNVYRSVLGKYQNCTDPASDTAKDSSLPLCNATTTVLASTPSGFTTPFTEPTTAGGSQTFTNMALNLCFVYLVLLFIIY